jgi:signal transduction histidine kinase
MQITGRALRLHLVAYSALSLMLTLGLVVVVAWFPLRHRALDGAAQTLRQTVELRARLVDESLRRAADIGWQVAGRREGLEEALEASVQARGLLRVDQQGRTLAEAGAAMLDTLGRRQARYPLLDAPPLRHVNRGRQGLSSLLRIGAETHALVFTPVFSPDRREVAQDLLLCRLDGLDGVLELTLGGGLRAAVLVLGRSDEYRPPETLLRAGPPTSAELEDHGGLAPLLTASSQVESRGTLLVAAAPLQSCRWWLVLAAPSAGLLRESRGWFLTVLLAVLGLGLIGLLGSLALMRPLRDKILVAQDDLRRQVAGMEQIRAQLEQQTERLLERNEDLRHFAYASAHDLKSPLISMGGHAQMLLDRLGPELPPERRQSLEYILAASKRMFQHVNDMIDYSRAAEIEPRPARLSLERLCQEILASLEGRIREGGATVKAQPMPEVVSDRRLLRMILQNLIDNALCYRQPDRPAEILLSAAIDGQEVVIRVQDNGLGIAPDQQPQVFETFYRLHDEAKIPGTGLGLAICLRAVKRLGGSIELESEPGRGSCFTVRLPQSSATVPPPEADEAGLA